MKSHVLLSKLAVCVHGLIGAGCALAATYNALKGSKGRTVLYAAVTLHEAFMVNQHLNELNFRRPP
mgnify:CR=1 FL=1